MWPRHYAAQIAELKTLQERREALEKVPEHFKSIVKTHLRIKWQRDAASKGARGDGNNNT